MKRAHILHHDQSVWGVVRDGAIVLPWGQEIALDTAHYLPVTAPTKIFATHLTYRSRCEEYKMAQLPPHPHFFMMPPTSIAAHGAAVARPRGTKFLNYEGEIAVVIDKQCKNVRPEEVLSYVRGYTIANDFGLHDMRHVDRGAMTRVKGQDGYCPIGPFLVDTADLNPDDLTLRTYVNGKLVQETHTGSDLLFSIAYQIADVARYITLLPGDLILTGTPAHSRPLDIGDVVEVEVSGIGTLRNHVVELDYDIVPIGYQPEVTAATLHVALAIPEDEAAQRVQDYIG